MKVYNMKTRSGNKAVNQFIIETDDVTAFQSYQSTIAVKKLGQSLQLSQQWDYSKTTLQYLKEFIYLQTGEYVTKKDIEKNLANGKYMEE